MYEYDYNYLYAHANGSASDLEKIAPPEVWVAVMCIARSYGDFKFYVPFKATPDFQSLQYRVSCPGRTVSDTLWCYIYSEFDPEYQFPDDTSFLPNVAATAQELVFKYLANRQDRLYKAGHKKFALLLLNGLVETGYGITYTDWPHGRTLLTSDDYSAVVDYALRNNFITLRWAVHFFSTDESLMRKFIKYMVDAHFIHSTRKITDKLFVHFTAIVPPDMMEPERGRMAKALATIIRSGRKRIAAAEFTRAFVKHALYERSSRVGDNIMRVGNMLRNLEMIDPEFHRAVLDSLDTEIPPKVLAFAKEYNYQELARYIKPYLGLYKVR